MLDRNRKKILTLSCGDVRGIVTAVWLKNIESELKRMRHMSVKWGPAMALT